MPASDTGAFVYTRDGFLPTKHADGTFFVVYRHPNKSLITRTLSYAKTELANIEKDKSLDIISETAVQIDRLAGVELAYTNEPQKSLLFVTLLFDGKDAIIIFSLPKKIPSIISECSINSVPHILTARQAHYMEDGVGGHGPIIRPALQSL